MNSVKKNFIYNSAYQILVILIPLITTPYISRILGPTGTGRYSYGYSIATYFVMFIMLGLNNYGNRSVAMVRDDKKKLSYTFWSIRRFQLLCGIIVSIIYIGYTMLFSDDVIMSWILFVYVISACLDINWLFFGLEQFKITVTRNTCIKLLTVIGIFVFVKTKNDVYQYALIYVLGMILSQVYLWLILYRYVDKAKVGIKDMLPHIKPNLILFIPVIAVSLYKVMDKIMLGAMTTKTQVGYYEACERIINVPLALVNSLGMVMLPRMTNLFAKNDTSKSRTYMKKSLLLAMFLSTSLSFGIMAVSPEFVPIFYGKGYDICIDLFKILLPSGVFMAFANVLRTQYLIPKQKDTIFIVSLLSGTVINMLINVILIPHYQAVGAAIGTLCAEASVCIVQSYAVRKEVPIKQYVLQSVPFVTSGILMFGMLYNFSLDIDTVALLAIKVLAGAILYFALLLFFLLLQKLFQKTYMKTKTVTNK